MAHEVFISYSNKDQKIVEGLSAYLEQNGVRCFVAYRDIPRGIVWASVIPKALNDCKLMVVVFSDHFNGSPQVDREIELCANRGKPILTFRIDEAAFTGVKEYYLQNINWIDAFPDPQACFGELLAAVRKLLPDAATPPEHYRINLVKQSDLPVRASEPSAPPPAQPASPALQNPCILKIRPNADCNVYVDEEFKLKAEANRISKLPLNKGTFWLEFVSTENEQDKYACEYKLTDNEELIKVDLESIATVRKEREQQERVAITPVAAKSYGSAMICNRVYIQYLYKALFSVSLQKYFTE
jgi:hypothetical protein